MVKISLLLEILSDVWPWVKRLFKRRRKCLLVVDDDEVDSTFLASLIENYGYEASVVSLADSAYELIKREPEKYKIVFIDLRLPQMGGLRFVDLVTTEFPLLHLVIVAGLADDLVNLRPSIYCGVILKPVSKKSVAAVLLKTKM